MSGEPLRVEIAYVAPPGGVVAPVSGPVGDLFAPGRYVLPPICISDGCPAPLLGDEQVLSRWLVTRTKGSPAELIGTYEQGGSADSTRRGPVVRSSWYALLTTRYLRLLGVLPRSATVLVGGRWRPQPTGTWAAFAFDLRTVTHYSGSRRRVELGTGDAAFSATAFLPAVSDRRGWDTPSTKPSTVDVALELGRALLQAKRDSGDADQEGAADEHARSDWEAKVTGRLRRAEMAFPAPRSAGSD